MTVLQLNILCNKDERDDDTIRVAEQLKELGIPIKNEDNQIKDEWRLGFVNSEMIEAFFPSGKQPEHTILQMVSGNSVTIKENLTEVLSLLAQFPTLTHTQTTTADGQRVYNYPATIS